MLPALPIALSLPLAKLRVPLLVELPIALSLPLAKLRVPLLVELPIALSLPLASPATSSPLLALDSQSSCGPRPAPCACARQPEQLCPALRACSVLQAAGNAARAGAALGGFALGNGGWSTSRWRRSSPERREGLSEAAR
jgi:hypothetical protein